jgi:hypothetical protein
VRRPEHRERKKSEGEQTLEGKISKTKKMKRQLTFNLLLLHLESAALGLDRLL